MNSIPLTQIQVQTPNDYSDPTQGVVISFDSALRSSKNHSKSCIFCRSTAQTQKFKGKAVCLSCLQHIPALFVHKAPQLV